MKDKQQIRPEDFKSFTAFHDAGLTAGLSLEEIHEIFDAHLEKAAKELDADLASPERKEILELVNE